jgi:eukaryotic-like serine/threonine-protein kinase
LYQGKLYFGGGDGRVYALEAATGKFLWKTEFAAGNKIWGTSLVNEDTLYIGSFDKKMYAINIADGTKKWEFTTDGGIINTPLLKNNVLYFGSFDRYFYAVDITSHDLVWKSESALNWFWADPLLNGDVIFAPNVDGKVYVYSTDKGQKINEINLNAPISSKPVIVGSKLIVATENGKSSSKLYAIDTTNYTNKQLVNLNSLVYGPLTANQNIVYIHTFNDMIHAFNADTEVVLWSQAVLS